MKVSVKYWPKDKSFTISRWKASEKRSGKPPKISILFDGRSKKYKEWLYNTPMVVTSWSSNAVEWEGVEENQRDIHEIIMRTIFERGEDVGLEQ